MSAHRTRISRRAFLRLGAGASLAYAMPGRPVFAADGVPEYQLVAGTHKIRLAGEPFPETEVWCYNGQVPGPQIRVKRGATARIVVRNQLFEGTTVHWHGLRIPNAFDGVPFLTQSPIEPGEAFVYEFTPPDAGTFWYHSHMNPAEQLGRGLYGPLIIEEAEPIKVDRDIVWVLDDWRLTREAQIKGDFHNPDDFSRAGRIGNTITVNGKTPSTFQVRAGERIRLRLINAANARIFSVRFHAHEPRIIALDGQPVEPYVPRGGAVQVAPAQRVDVVLDMSGKPGQRSGVIDSYYPQAPFKLFDIAYSDEAPLRESPLDAPIRLPVNPLKQPDLSAPHREDVILEGGDLGQLGSAELRGRDVGISELFMLGKMWAINGVSGFRTKMPPLFELPLGKTVMMHFQNRSSWPHPMHMHGHHFRIIEHNGDESMVGKWRDTVLLGPGEQAKVAFVADNPGDWLFHCHIATHAEAGMVAVIRVA